ncbi:MULTISPECIES: CBS domain-containing protein [unclassified Methanoregula]|uniref:CBS domain-containing protein n=1 Tax=unclassified Methanoregula TaxID=2649730 RepID=UPI0009D1263B|nr:MULTISPECIES: CBS domain-containing protein [unclassified Methanoregula]OPX64057.1 MAG: Inosine-5'-monophosphate dehydrogenase [Methanoregula sp. PtaB.Bin085]OPY33745.1 MAG: Inosine-5'-monophosphate dehydrogenase [Methanoregula sp. PtaU1.Bin006]
MRTAQDFILEIPVLKPGDPITKARQILRDDRFREVYVADAKRNLLGYIDLTDGLRVTATKSNITIEGFVKEAPMVHPADPIEAAARAMRSYRTDSAAVVDPEPRIAGGVLLADLFPVIISRHELHGTVETRMSRDVVVVEPDDGIAKVYARIVESGFSAFPVMKKRRLAGIISRRDLIGSRRVRSVVAENAKTPVESIMNTDVVTIAPGEPVSAAAELLVRHDVSRLPVLDGNRLVGIIDRHDVLASLG